MTHTEAITAARDALQALKSKKPPAFLQLDALGPIA